MTLGNRIKQLRQNLSLSQPELARSIGIEQSYLSKLENDKYLPSNDTFRALLNSFSTNIHEFLSDIDIDSERNRLKQIPDVEQWLQTKNKQSINSMKYYLSLCCFLISLGSAMLYAGVRQVFFNDIHFEYHSYGILMIDEPDNFFRNWRSTLPRGNAEAIEKLRLEIENRQDFEVELSKSYRGQSFVIQFDKSKRHYEFKREVKIPQLSNAWLQFIGVILLTGGIIGLVVENRFLKRNAV